MQIDMHTEADKVRVKVLDSRRDSKPLTALDIAWHYDVVITTFQRLSIERSLGKRSSYTSALIQVTILDHFWPRLLKTTCKSV